MISSTVQREAGQLFDMAAYVAGDAYMNNDPSRAEQAVRVMQALFGVSKGK